MTRHDPIYNCLMCGNQALGGRNTSINSIFDRGGVLIHSWSAYGGLSGGGLGGETYICNDCTTTKTFIEIVDEAWKRAWAIDDASV